MQREAGTRIREARFAAGIKQGDVARHLGISASYLNLIEHNRRRIAPEMLERLAEFLGVDPQRLRDGADPTLVDRLAGVSASLRAGIRPEPADEFANRFPGWSKLVVAQQERMAALEARVKVASDRVALDPQLASALHEVITAVSGIRSAASILAGPDELDADWQRRFHENIYADSIRLVTSSEALIANLNAPDIAAEGLGTPLEQVADFLAEHDFHLPELEVRKPDIGAFVASSGLNTGAAEVLSEFASRYAADAQALPLDNFAQAAQTRDYDPALLARMFAVPLSQAMRRLAHLPDSDGHPPMGLVTCDASGYMTFQKPVQGFILPRSGGSCPLWPLFGALSRPAQPIRAEVALPLPAQTRFLCYAIAEQTAVERYDSIPSIVSTMLVVPDPPETGTTPAPVGLSCRMCARSECTSRREPSAVGAGG